MHINRSALSQQHRVQHRVQHYAAANDAFDFFNTLTSPDLLETLEASLPDHRERLFPPTETLSMFLAQALKPDRSCQGIVDDAAVKRLIHGLPHCSTNTVAYCKARKRLPLETVAGMVRHTGRLISAEGSDTWLWRGRRVRLVDGTPVILPDTRANQTAYPQQRGQKPGLGFPHLPHCGGNLPVQRRCARRGHGRVGSGEQARLRTLLDIFATGDVMLGDAFYGTYFLLAELCSRGAAGVAADLVEDGDGESVASGVAS